MKNSISKNLRSYNAMDLYLASFRYCTPLERNYDADCYIMGKLW